MRGDALPDDALVIDDGVGALPRKVLGTEPLDQVGHGRSGALLLDRPQRVAAVLDLTAQLARLVAGYGAAPDRGVADRVGARATGPGRVAQHVGPRPVGGDASAEAPNRIVDKNDLALGWRVQALDDGISEPLLWHGTSPPLPASCEHVGVALFHAHALADRSGRCAPRDGCTAQDWLPPMNAR